ncbi:conserved hypothetical protein [anaerobic digester metagenome]|uniref:DUF370 domain-containing protein n=1 Tax=anaerobic digester metagenome TaxID=1263854 RepID=A0A485M520_9ZZZZ
MFLHLGGDVVVPKKDVIMILDTHTLTSSATREFIEIAGDEDFIKNTSGDKEKSYVVTTREIFISPISCKTLQKRARSSKYLE